MTYIKLVGIHMCILVTSLIAGVPINRPVSDYLAEQLEIQRRLLESLQSVVVESTQVYTRGGPVGELTRAEGPCNATTKDCLALYENGCETDGVYLIDPSHSGNVIRVFCDMSNNGGGWTVIQQRVDASVNFYRSWETYVGGFGLLTGNYWLGLESIHQLTTQDDNDEISEIFIYMEDFDGDDRFAKYSNFYIDDYMSFYKLHVSGYYGTAGDSFSVHNNARFSSYDMDLDTYAGNCARTYNGAWWYASCHHSNLNGFYLNGVHSSYANGVNWYYWRGHKYSLKTTVMKVRRHPN